MAFWVVIVFMLLPVVLLVLGQTMAVFNDEFAVSLRMQEDIKEISEFGVQLNRSFGNSDTLISGEISLNEELDDYKAIPKNKLSALGQIFL